MLPDVCLTSVCLSDVWRLWRTSGLSQEQRGLGRLNGHSGSPRHTWLGHHFQGQKVKGQGHQAALFTAALTRQASAAVSRGNLLLRCGLHSAGAVGSVTRGASAPTDGGEGRGHIVAAARLQLVWHNSTESPFWLFLIIFVSRFHRCDVPW